MRVVIPVFLILFSIILLNLGSNDILTYAEENKTNNIVIKDSNLIVEEYVSGLNLPVMIDFIGDDDGVHMLVIEKDGTVRIIKDEILKLYPNINKAKEKINWRPKISFKKGLESTIQYYNEQAI